MDVEALGDELFTAATQRARNLAGAQLALVGVALSDESNEGLALEVGLMAGIAAGMEELMTRGMIRPASDA